jgi:hypothetical protein
LPTLYCLKSISLNSSLAHVKTKIEQENAEEGAVGGINNIAAIKLDAGEYAKAEESWFYFRYS